MSLEQFLKIFTTTNISDEEYLKRWAEDYKFFETNAENSYTEYTRSKIPWQHLDYLSKIPYYKYWMYKSS